MSLIRKTFAIGVAALLPLLAQADSLTPAIPKAKKNYDDQTLCVEPVEEMRKNHMTYIMHQRDDTMRRGIRTSKHSLKECIDCHNAPAEDGKVASIESDEHFCAACHNYAAVKIDCFSCHSDKPVNTQYRHALSGKDQPHHRNFAQQEINAGTLDLLTGSRESQQ